MSLLHEADEARDIVQEVFLKLWESEVRFENPSAFILTAVRNACLNRINSLDTRERIRKRIMLDSPQESVDFEGRNDEVRTAISQTLSPREQEVVGRIYMDGMSYKEAANALEVSVAAVNKHVVSALRKLRTYFKTGKS